MGGNFNTISLVLYHFRAAYFYADQTISLLSSGVAPVSDLLKSYGFRLVVERSSLYREASLLIVQFLQFSGIHAYCHQLRCSLQDSEEIPAI